MWHVRQAAAQAELQAFEYLTTFVAFVISGTPPDMQVKPPLIKIPPIYLLPCCFIPSTAASLASDTKPVPVTPLKAALIPYFFAMR